MSQLDTLEVEFTKRPSPVPVEYRPLYKISLVLLVAVLCGRGGKISLAKLQFFVWGTRTAQNRIAMEGLLANRFSLPLWGLDPTVIRAINFAIGEGLCERNGTNIQISQSGKSFVDRLLQAEVLTDHIKFLQSIGKSVSEQKIRDIAKGWLS